MELSTSGAEREARRNKYREENLIRLTHPIYSIHLIHSVGQM